MIEFAVRSPSEADFWLSFQDANICDAERKLLPPYDACVQVADWGGAIPDAEGNAKPGWFCNVRVGGVIEAQMAAGLVQRDSNGDLLPVFQRTRAAQAFRLTDQPKDEASGFPAGMRNTRGVHYADVADISTPFNVWA